MKLTKDTRILIVGLGPMGGSYAKGLADLGYCVDAVTKEMASIDFAREKGWILEGAITPDPAIVGRADLVIFALYPTVFIDWIQTYQSLLKPGCILTDVTGVKGEVVSTIQEILRPDLEFIAHHPMAGREATGVENSTTDIFKGANYIVVPTEKNTEGAIELCKDLGHLLGFKTVTELSPENHDRMIAFLSQLTHCIAVSLMCACSDPNLEQYTGDSFRDLTRIAKINDEMWSELFLMNKKELLASMDGFMDKFQALYRSIDKGDREDIRQMMRTSTQQRKKFDKNETF